MVIIDSKFIGLNADLGDFEIKFVMPSKFRAKNKASTANTHIHFETEIHFILNGKYTLITDDNSYTLKKHTVCIIPKGISHEMKPESSDSRVFNALLSINPLRMKTKRKSICLEKVQLWKDLESVQTFDGCEKLCRYVEDLLECKQENEYLSKSIITIIFFGLTEIIRERFPCRSRLADACQIHYDGSYFDAELENYIMLRYKTKMTLTDVAEHIGISAVQLSRIIKKNYGMNYSELITTLRMNEVKRLFQSGMSMTAIAKELGYTSYNGFSAAFRRHFNQSPNNFNDKGEQK